MADQEEGNIRQQYNNATTGLNLDQSLAQVPKGKLTYALNAAVENFDANGVSYQNEPGNEFCVDFPEGYKLIGKHFIPEKNKHIFMLANPSGESQIGYMDNNDCVYRIYINDACLGFDVDYPIHKIVHKITNCSTEIYWADNVARRFLDLENIPYVQTNTDLCNPIYGTQVDCNQLKIQPNFSVPQIEVVKITNTGSVIAGTYQFAAQYSDAVGNPYTSYYSITNPTPIADPNITTPNFNYPVGKSIVISVSNLDTTGQFNYFNLAVIKTINAIASVELVGTYFIEERTREITYSGTVVDNIRLSIDDIFEKFPYYDLADDITTAQDILIWDQLGSIDRINYQEIANKITLWWETWRIPATENYADEINATNLRTYLRDEVYPFEFVPVLANGKELDSFHIPGRIKNQLEESIADIPSTNPDFIGDGLFAPYWKIYNTATVLGTSPDYTTASSYKGPYKYGEFAYWESTEEYQCNADVWGELAGQKIRHHKFPDVAISPIFESQLFTTPSGMIMSDDAVFPIGVRVDVNQIQQLIQSSSLTAAQKADIVGFKITRGDRSTNKSIVAKGILRNVNQYTKDENTYYFPNYPYNDLREDPFINSTNNAFTVDCDVFDIEITELLPNPSTGILSAEINYVDCNTNKSTKAYYTELKTDRICSVGKPTWSYGVGTISYVNYDRWYIGAGLDGCHYQYNDITEGIKTDWVHNENYNIQVVIGTSPSRIDGDSHNKTNDFYGTYIIAGPCTTPEPIPPVIDKTRQIFNSPETSFGQPFLGNVLKLESVIFGKGQAHFTEVKDNAKYRLVTEEAQRAALDSSAEIANLTGDFDASAMFTAYQSYLTIYINGITRKNYAYSFNSIANYNYCVAVPDNQGVKQRMLDTARYLIPAVLSIDGDKINNWNRESSVYLKTTGTELPFPDSSPNMPAGANKVIDYSRFTISEVDNCNKPGHDVDITTVSYYASIKNIFDNQWGQIYSYPTIDTGFQRIFSSQSQYNTVFGGDTFISRFAFKTKLPFFIDNRVKAPDDSDIFYDEIGNVGYPKYWHSARSILKDYSAEGLGTMVNLISYKAHNFDCPNDMIYTTGTPGSTTTSTTTVQQTESVVTPGSAATYYDGYFYLFAYGVPSFYCESSYNTDLRQAFNNREGDFWPHVTSGIPDDWVQESFVSIANDNTYTYNVTYSKQNKENVFTHIPADWENDECVTRYPFRSIHSDPQNTDSDNRVNAWRTYRALSYYDFPQNFGALISLDGIQNRAVLARFENKTLLYNSLLTIDTSNPQAAYVGNPKLFSNPPIDFAETDLGYVGSQNKMLLKIPEGQISADAKRGQVFLISGQQAVDLSGFGSGLQRFFTDHLAFEILRYFPTVDTDNNFTGIGLHGVYDSKYDRVILTKLDYVPLTDDVKYDPVTKEYYIEEVVLSGKCNISGSVTQI